jgi:LAO/AO transport system kinase
MADRPGAPETVRHIRLALGRELVVKQTVATEGEGVAELRAELDGRWERLVGSDELREARLRKQVAEATLVAEEWLRACSANGHIARPDNLKLAVKQILEEASKQWQQ